MLYTYKTIEALANINIQEVNVNSGSGYPMISPHSNNKEVN